MIPTQLSPRRHGSRGRGLWGFGVLCSVFVVTVGSVFPCVGKVEAQATGQATAHGQRWEVHVDSGRVTVGDPVTLHFRVRLDERDLLFDSLPKPVDSLLDGVRIVSVEKLVRQPNRDFLGTATLAFYRSGPQPVPVFGLPFMRAVKGISRGTVLSDTLSVDVVPVLAAGNPSLRDIRELTPVPWPRLLLGALAAGVLVLLLVLLRRRARKASGIAEPAPEPEPAPPPVPDPYETALARLGAIELEEWPARGEVDRHYELVADTLRDYLEDAERVPARERTTSELFWSLPPRLLEGGLRQRYALVFEEADLVKFARRRPEEPAAATFLIDARTLLTRWRAATRPPAAETVDALG